MRDLVLVTAFAVMLPFVFKHPVLGAYMWAWLGLMNPHKLTYGFAFSFPFSQIVALVTLVSFLATRKRQPLPRSPLVWVLLCMFAWMTLTSFFAIADSRLVLDRWMQSTKIFLMLFVTWMLVTDAKQLRTLVWVVTLSVVFYGVKGGIWTVTTGGGGRVLGPAGGMLEDNNALAIGLVMLMPMLHFLRETDTRRWVRLALLFAMVTTAFSILGSQSRGALLATLSIAFFLGLKGKYPVRTSLALVVVVASAVAFMPDTWTSRMETIQTYQQDGSAMSRLWTWNTLWNVALDRPLGAGFAADNDAVFSRYGPLDGEYAVFAGRAYVAHSIYFQMLGEHGFVGLGLFLTLGALTWVGAARVARAAAKHAEYSTWMPNLMRMVQVSLVGYAVGGAFLSLAYLDLPYYIMGFVVQCWALLRRDGSPTATVNQSGGKPLPRQNIPTTGLGRPFGGP